MSVDIFGRSNQIKEGKRGIPGIGFKYTKEGDYDIQSKRLCNLAPAIQPEDSTNKEYVDSRNIKLEQELVDLINKDIRRLDLQLSACSNSITTLYADTTTKIANIEERLLEAPVKNLELQVQGLSHKLSLEVDKRTEIIRDLHYLNASMNKTNESLQKIETEFDGRFEELNNTIDVIRQRLNI